MAKTRINISNDAGHMGEGKSGGKILDPGAVNKNTGRKECDDVLRMATRVMEIVEKLSKNEIMCYRTRTGSKYQELSDKSSWINNWSKDGKKFNMSISFHRDSSTNLSARGATAIYYTNGSKDSRVMANNLSEALVKYFPGRSQPVQARDLHMVRVPKCPAVLIEIGFITNEEDNRIFDEKFEQIATDLARQILRFYGIFPKKSETRYKVSVSGMTDKSRQKKITDFLDDNGFKYNAESYEVEL